MAAAPRTTCTSRVAGGAVLAGAVVRGLPKELGRPGRRMDLFSEQSEMRGLDQEGPGTGPKTEWQHSDVLDMWVFDWAA